MSEYNLIMPFWIDTDAYSDRDREMFVCGVEFEMVVQLLMSGWRGSRPIHRENESRLRMAAGQIGVPVKITQHEGYDGCEDWSELEAGSGR